MLRPKILTVLLIGVIMALLIPLLGQVWISEQAFTSNNLITIDLVSR